MSRLNPGRFLAGLVVEGIGVVAVVGLLPQLPWNQLAETGRNIADQRPTLVERVPAEPVPAELPPADPAYIERRLDQASQHLLEGAASYLQQHAQELLQPVAAPIQAQPQFVSPGFSPAARSFNQPTNTYRY